MLNKTTIFGHPLFTYAIAPILSRQKRPDPQIWITYFKTSPTPVNPVPEAD